MRSWEGKKKKFCKRRKKKISYLKLETLVISPQSDKIERRIDFGDGFIGLIGLIGWKMNGWG
jgi:hypothetical protein